MKDALKSAGGTLLGLAVFGAIITALCLFFAFGTKIAFSIEPCINGLAGVLFLIDIVALVLTISSKMRPFVGLVLFVSSYVFGLSTWIYGLAVTLSLWGVLALIIGLFMGGIGVVPIGMLAALFHGKWGIFFMLLFTLILTYGTRLAGTALAESTNEKGNQSLREHVMEGEVISDIPHRTWEDLQ